LKGRICVDKFEKIAEMDAWMHGWMEVWIDGLERFQFLR
jgi:glycyl-tRNA synthetase alpha subunit